ALVAPAALVLGRDRRVDEHLWDLIEADDLAVLLRELIKERVAGPVVDLGPLRERGLGEILWRGQFFGEEGERRACPHDEEPCRREDHGEQARRQCEAQTAERAAALAPVRAICTAAARMVKR